jgi:hypothetical protein
VNVCESVINLVTVKLPKMLIGSNQKKVCGQALVLHNDQARMLIHREKADT